MNNEVWLALIAMVGTTVAAIISAVVAVRTSKKTEEVKQQVAGIHNSVNSKMDALLAAAKELARIEGRDAERERAKKEEQK